MNLSSRGVARALRIASALGLLCINTPLQAAFTYDPSLTWRTLNTANFIIHYHDGEADAAQHVAQVAERIHPRIAEFLHWTPRDPTHVVIRNREDYSNGFATPLPRNTMTLLLTPPDELGTLEDYHDWLDLLITHEYTHIVHLDRAESMPGGLRGAFGRMVLLFPNVLQPTWFIEGLATYKETDAAQGVGRGQANDFRMLMRLEVDAGIKPVTQVNQTIESWPGGAAPYLYGEYFYEFVRERYGEARIEAMVADYSRHMIPFSINRTSDNVFGKDVSALWDEYTGYLEQQFRPEIEALRTAGIVAGERITDDGYYTGAPQVDTSGNVYYLRQDQLSEPVLMRLPRDGAAQEVVAVHGDRIALHLRAGIVLAQLDAVDNVNIYGDLYHIDPATGQVRRLTEGGRYRYAAWHPDGLSLVAVQNHGLSASLEVLGADGQHRKTLWHGVANEVISAPTWSPDGESIVAGVKRPGRSWNLERYTLATGAWQRLTDAPANESEPYFSADGKQLYFVADYDGVYNVQRMDLTSGAVQSITRVMGGAFTPQPSPDGRTLYYRGATAKGYDLFRLALDAAPARPVTLTHEAAPAAPIPSALAAVANDRPYTPTQSLLPTWWFPYFYVDDNRAEYGAQTSGSDVLQRHNYYALAAYDTQNDWFTGALSYGYDRYDPSLRFYAARQVLTDLQPNGLLERFRTLDNLSAQAILPFITYDRQWALHAGLVVEKESDLRVAGSAGPAPNTSDALVGLAVTYNTAKHFPRGISPVQGRKLTAVVTDSDTLQSDYTGQVYQVDWREYPLLPGRRHALYAHLGVGFGTDKPRPFRLGGTLESTLPGSPYEAMEVGDANLFNMRRISLRGYPEGLPGLVGRRMAIAELEWRFPVALVERGIMVPPIGLQRVHGRLFGAIGDAWRDRPQQAQWHRSAGAEVLFEGVFGYRLPIDARLGYAHGMDEGGESQVYLGVGIPLP